MTRMYPHASRPSYRAATVKERYSRLESRDNPPANPSCAIFTKIAFLWYNVIGAVVVVVSGVLISKLTPRQRTI